MRVLLLFLLSDRFYFTEKVLLTSKHSSFVLFLREHLHMYYITTVLRRRIGVKTTTRTVRDFATRRFRTSPVSKNPVSFTIVRTLKSMFWWSVSIGSVIHSMGRPFCFCTNTWSALVVWNSATVNKLGFKYTRCTWFPVYYGITHRIFRVLLTLIHRRRLWSSSYYGINNT